MEDEDGKLNISHLGLLKCEGNECGVKRLGARDQGIKRESLWLNKDVRSAITNRGRFSQ